MTFYRMRFPCDEQFHVTSALKLGQQEIECCSWSLRHPLLKLMTTRRENALWCCLYFLNTCFGFLWVRSVSCGWSCSELLDTSAFLAYQLDQATVSNKHCNHSKIGPAIKISRMQNRRTLNMDAASDRPKLPSRTVSNGHILLEVR